MLGIGIGLMMAGQGGAGFTGVLDGLESTSIAAARSVRKRLTVDWTGSLIRVRRASDNAELDIGYGADNLLDTTALAAHINATTGHLVTIYDQTGLGRHDQQATTSLQPTVAANGTVTWNGTSHYMQATGFETGTNAITAYPFEMFARFSVDDFTTSTSHTLLALRPSVDDKIYYGILNRDTGYECFARNTIFRTNSITRLEAGVFGIGSGQWAGSTSRIPRLDGSTGTNTDTGAATFAATVDRVCKGSVNAGGVGPTYLAGRVTDDVIFASAVSAADRTYLEANL